MTCGRCLLIESVWVTNVKLDLLSATGKNLIGYDLFCDETSQVSTSYSVENEISDTAAAYFPPIIAFPRVVVQ